MPWLWACLAAAVTPKERVSLGCESRSASREPSFGGEAMAARSEDLVVLVWLFIPDLEALLVESCFGRVLTFCLGRVGMLVLRFVEGVWE